MTDEKKLYFLLSKINRGIKLHGVFDDIEKTHTALSKVDDGAFISLVPINKIIQEEDFIMKIQLVKIDDSGCFAIPSNIPEEYLGKYKIDTVYIGENFLKLDSDYVQINDEKISLNFVPNEAIFAEIVQK